MWWNAMRRRTRTGERGQSIVIVVLAMAALIAIAAYAIDTSEWWNHSHHLQVEADAAALAAAQSFSPGECAGEASTEVGNAATAAAVYSGSGNATYVPPTSTTPTTTTPTSSIYNQEVYPTNSTSTTSTGQPTITTELNSSTFGSMTSGSDGVRSQQHPHR